MTNKQKGIWLLAGPIIGLIVTLSSFAVLTYFAGASPIPDTVFHIARILITLIGIICFIGILIGAPFGIYFLSNRELTEQELDAFKQAGFSDAQISYIKGFSPVGFFFPAIFALGNKLWFWAVLSMLPLVNIYAWVKLTISGKHMAFYAVKPERFSAFKKRQQVIGLVGVVILALYIIIGIINYIEPIA